ncbi:MAG: UDP-glucose/GDP-mannose dehydrogenase family protein [Clostridiales bacterium]|nr:UDP-glucose/GDP-mannose dehydrogenase family protein [Clostridiales bacterium]
MVVTVFGLGFVGLTTAVGFAEKGVKVYGYDVDKSRCAILSSGKLPFFEPGLDKALIRHLNHNFILCEDAEAAVKESDCIYLCVGTPYGEGGQADLTYLFSAVDLASEALKDGKFRVVVTKSTIPPSTSKEKIIPYIEQKGLHVGTDVGVANNPEFLREGYCWDDFMHADRIVLGVSDPKSEEILKNLYRGFDIPIFSVSLNTGEFIKYLSNTLLATLISFSNEMSVIADTVGDIEVAKAFQILHMDKRWGGCGMTSYVYPGCGYGGYCLPKDTNALFSLAKSKGFEPHILGNVIKTNDSMPDMIAERIERNLKQDTKIGILGLSFKPNSDDVRDTPAAKIIQRLLSDGYTHIEAYDPLANQEFHKHYGYPISYAATMEECISKADILVILTGWDEFKNAGDYTDKKVIDCRYIL